MEEYTGKICPRCQQELQADAAVTVCPDCGTFHHKQCWEEGNGCAFPECPSKQISADEPVVAEAAQPETAQTTNPEAAPPEAEAPEAAAAKSATPTHCPSCGTAIPEDCSFCPSCGRNVALVAAVNPAIEAFNQQLTEKKKKKKKFLKLWLPIILAAAVLLIAASVIFFFIPNSKYQEAKELYADGEYQAAMEIYQELGGFKDSPEQVEICVEAINQETYQQAMELFADNCHGQAIALLQTLGDYEDSKEKIEEIKTAYLQKAQEAYAMIVRGYDTDKKLGDCVYTVLFSADLYDGYISTAMSRLYSGSSYLVYYYWSWYYNGYEYVVTSSTAQAFVSLMELCAANENTIGQAMLCLQDPPEEYKALSDGLEQLYEDYLAYRAFLKEEPYLSYSNYKIQLEGLEEEVDASFEEVETEERIDDRVDEFAWSEN